MWRKRHCCCTVEVSKMSVSLGGDFQVFPLWAHSQIVFLPPAGNTTSPRERPGPWIRQDNLREMKRQRDNRGESTMRKRGNSFQSIGFNAPCSRSFL